MMKYLIVFVQIIFCVFRVETLPAKNEISGQRISTRMKVQLFLERSEDFTSNSVVAVTYQSVFSQSSKSQKKSISKAVLMSAVLPGSGEIYGGSYFKGAAFLAVEALSILGYLHFLNRGNDLETGFERFADMNWNENDYWDWVYDISVQDPDGGGISRTDMSALREYERNRFSHFLPEIKNQQYYENVGKYNQFVAGWIDFNGTNYSLQQYLNGPGPESSKRLNYIGQRKDANDNFQRATNLLTITFLNHVLSAIDAGFTVKRRNEKLIELNVGFKPLMYDNNLVSSLKIGVSW